jgi:methyl coenzyme M reductase subunit C
MGTQKGGTFPIHPKMYEAISSADIILIDLTGIRPNVCVEAGFALRHHEKNRLIFIFEPTKKQKSVPFDLNTFCYQPISNTAEISKKSNRTSFPFCRVQPVVRAKLRSFQ